MVAVVVLAMVAMKMINMMAAVSATTINAAAVCEEATFMVLCTAP